MAVQVRTRRLVNPGVKRRKLSPKQIAIFGTPRQKAALRASKSRRRSNGLASKRKSTYSGKGPRGQAVKFVMAKAKSHKRRKNVGEIVSISLAGLANPGKKRSTGMAKRKRSTVARVAKRRVVRRRKNSGTAVVKRRTSTHRKMTARRRRSNPTYRVRRIVRRRSNSGKAMGMGLTSGIMGKAIGVIAGAVGARYLTQMALGANNTGYIGYAGNLAASIALGMVTKKVLKNKDLGNSVMLGGVVSTLLRVISEKSSYGSYIQASLSGAGKSGDIGMGLLTDSSFPTPQTFAPGSMTQAVVPAATRNYVGAQVAQSVQMARAGSPGKGMGSMVGRRARGSVI